jgi:hypothetical protein
MNPRIELSSQGFRAYTGELRGRFILKQENKIVEREMQKLKCFLITNKKLLCQKKLSVVIA